MIEDLEAEAVAQLVKTEHGGERTGAVALHAGVSMEVRARRRKDGGVIMGYSYAGVRLERAVLLLLICPIAACERSRSARRQWEARNPPPPALQRRQRDGLKPVGDVARARLFDDVPVGGAKNPSVARPASFAALTSCPVNAHEPFIAQMQGWDLFRDGKFIAGGVATCSTTGTTVPIFGSLIELEAWLIAH